METQPLSLNDDFKYALEVLEAPEQQHLLVMGRAGTGKSTLLRLFRNTTHQKAVYLAPTGIAALHIKGQTIHSFFGLPPRIIRPSEVLNRRRKSIYQKMDVLVIDEISMVRADVLDGIDILLRNQRGSNEPFGGVKCAFFGDIFQLPPVVSSPEERAFFMQEYGSPYFFDSHVWKEIQPVEPIELQQVFRQTDRRFLSILENMRYNRLEYDDFIELNERAAVKAPEDNVIILSPRRRKVQMTNQMKLDGLDTPAIVFEATIEGKVNIRQIPTDQQLILKEGAQVMFVKNDPEKRYVNGTLGKVVVCNHTMVMVDAYMDGEINRIELEAQSWETVVYKLEEKAGKVDIKAEVIGSFSQLPVKLAWAMTIHKSQGKTFDRVIIDLGAGAFESGQSYVAFSRCRSLEGIFLDRELRQRDVLLDQKLVDFYDNMR